MQVACIDTEQGEQLLCSGKGWYVTVQFQCHTCGHLRDFYTSTPRAKFADEEGGKGCKEKEVSTAVHVGARMAGVGVASLHRLFDSMGCVSGTSKHTSSRITDQVWCTRLLRLCGNALNVALYGKQYISPKNSVYLLLLHIQMHQRVDKQLQEGFKQKIEELKQEAIQEGRTRTVEMPDGSAVECVTVDICEDGQWCNRRNAACGWHTVLAVVGGRWTPIAQTVMQNNCQKCGQAFRKWIKEKLHEEIQHLTGKSPAWVLFLTKLRERGVMWMVGTITPQHCVLYTCQSCVSVFEELINVKVSSISSIAAFRVLFHVDTMLEP